MFIGQFGLAFAAKRVAPRTSLGTTFVAAQLADLLWPIFLLLGWETIRIVSPPPSSVTALAWGALIGWPLMLWPWWIDRHRERAAASKFAIRSSFAP